MKRIYDEKRRPMGGVSKGGFPQWSEIATNGEELLATVVAQLRAGKR